MGVWPGLNGDKSIRKLNLKVKWCLLVTGIWTGCITIANGETIPVHNLIGWAEDYIAR